MSLFYELYKIYVTNKILIVTNTLILKYFFNFEIS